MKKILAVTLMLAASTCFAEDKVEGSCKLIMDACLKSGFIKGEARKGDGLWVDCIDPIMKGGSQPAKAVRPLPFVKPDIVADCKAKHPDFGQGKPARKKK